MQLQTNIYSFRQHSSNYEKHCKPVMFGSFQYKIGGDGLNIRDISEDEVIQYLSNSGISNAQNAEGNTLLHELAAAGYFSAIKTILTNPSRAKELVNIQNNKGETPLDCAKNEKIKRFFLSKGGKSGSQLPKENAQTSSARIQVHNPNLMNVFKKRQAEPAPISPEPVLENSEKVMAEVPAPEPVEQIKPISEPVEIPVAADSEEIPTVVPETVQGTEKSIQPSVLAEEVTNRSNNTPETTYIRPAFPDELKDFTQLHYLPGDPQSMNDVIGLKEIKDELYKSIITPLTREETGELLGSNGVNIPNGILLTAPAGNGKTHLVKALSAETKLPVVELTNMQTLEPLVNTAEKLYNDKQQRIVLFIRGMENFVDNSSGSKCNCNQFARNLTSAAKRGILVVGTTTDKSSISKNVLVPGIIDKVFKLTVPDEEARTALLEKYLKDKPVFEEFTNPNMLDVIVKHTAGFSVAQLFHVMDEAARSAASRGDKKVELPVLLEEIKTYSKEQDIPEINEFNRTSMYDTVLKREQYKPGDPQSLDDIGGMKAVKEKVTEKIIEPWKHKDEMDKYGIGMPDGILFYGPPGSGKTYIVKGVARELKLPLYKLNLSDVASSFRHETVKNIKDIISQLKEKYERTGEASVLFLDELDSLGKAKDNANGADADEVNTLLQELDNAGDKGIIVMAATNKLDNIEAALARDGRLGERIYVGYADFESRVDMIRSILGGKPVTAEFANNNEFVKKLAEEFDDMPSGSIAKVLKEATYQMAVKGQPFDKSVQEAFENYKEKELDDHLTRKGVKNRGEFLKLSKNSTIKYDTTYDRTFLRDNEPHNFSELGGMYDVKEQLQKHIIDMWKPEVIELFKANGIALPGGVILSGPSANGKTTIVRALAGEMGVPLYELSYDDVADSHIHATSKKTHELFNQLAYKYKKTGEKSILLLDELDKFAPERSTLPANAEYKKEEVSELLSMMNDASENGIILVGTTNHWDMVDSAIKNNPRRMGINIHVNYPDADSRRGIIQKTLDGKPVAENLLNNPQTMDELTGMFEGCTIGRMTDTLRKAVVNSLIYKKDLTTESIRDLLVSAQGEN